MAKQSAVKQIGEGAVRVRKDRKSNVQRSNNADQEMYHALVANFDLDVFVSSVRWSTLPRIN